MSQMEYNKGILIPTGVKYSELTFDEYEEYFDKGYACVNGELYEVDWENQGEDLYEIARASVNEDNTINFETYHYNGGGHWTEIVEQALKYD